MEEVKLLLQATENVDLSLSSNQLWDDVEPILQQDGPNTVVNIAYDPEFREGMDFFRAIVASCERSLRVLALTKRVIALNPANYTAWHIRRECLFQLNCDLRSELEFVRMCGAKFQKLSNMVSSKSFGGEVERCYG